MSAYIVENRTINRIITAIRQDGYSPVFPSYVVEPLGDLGFDMANRDHLERLGDAMLALNIFSVQQRYPHDWLDMVPDEPFELGSHIESKYQYISSLSCFLYQACEGQAEESSLYLALIDVRYRMALALVRDTPQYRDAQWG